MKIIFEKAMWEDLTRTFDLKRLKDWEVLREWTDNAPLEVSKNYQKDLQRLDQLMIDNFWNWNEDELKMQFISPFGRFSRQ